MRGAFGEGKDDFLEFFCRHLVALCINYQQLKDKKISGEIEFFACPGVVINVRDVFYFLTAGHALQDWDDALRKEKIVVLGSVLDDTFGPNTISSKPIPFDFLNEPKFYINDEKEGLDFGLIMLRPHYVKLLEKNGIVAISEKNWVNQGSVEFHHYAMLGMPDELIKIFHHKTDRGLRVDGSVSLALISLKKAATPPENVKKTQYERFIGQLERDMPLDIKGMSGGPIFGFNLNHPIRYWIVAIQSSWLKSRRITFGCPLPVLANLLLEWTDEISKNEIV